MAYADLLRYYGFDLGDWLNGDDCTSIEGVISMLTTLPKHSAWAAHYTAHVVTPEHDTGEVADYEELTAEQRVEREFLERQEWSDTDLHLAQIGNEIGTVLSILVNSKDFKPEFMGPDFMLTPEDAEKRRERRIKAAKKASSKKAQRATSLEGLYQMMGAGPMLGATTID